MITLTSNDFAGRRILIVEDEFFFAEETAHAVRQAGGVVLGPVASVEEALALIDAGQQVDGAVLDIKLGDQTSFPVARTLRERGIPLIFVTGYDDWFIPQEHEDVPLYSKPMDADNVVRVLFEATRRDRDGS